MKNEKLLGAIGKIDDNLIYGAVNDTKIKRRPVWIRWGAMAACLCLVLTTVLFSVNAYAADINAALLDLETVPPEGLSLTIVDAAPDDAEFHIVNETDLQVTYGKANRIEKYDGTNWVEVTTESVGIFPATMVSIQPGQEMYGMCGWVTKRLILEPGTYRYLLVIEVSDTDNEPYHVVLKAEFEIE